MMRRLSLCLLLAIGVCAQTLPDAGARLGQLRADARKAREAKDSKAFLALVLEIDKLLHHSSRAAEQLALAYAAAGDQKMALQALNDFVAMGMADQRLPDFPEFSAMKSHPEFQQLLKDMDKNKAAIQRAAEFAQFGDSGLVPEDLDYDAQTRSFLATSVLERKIVRIAAGGAQSDFATPPDGWPLLAIKIDARRGLVWATAVALDKFVAAPEKDWGRSALLCLRLKDGNLLRRIEGPAHSALGDMALTSDGDVIVSDGAGGGVYRLRADAPANAQLERLDAGDFISPQTPVAHPDGRRVFVPDYVRGVAVLDLTTRQLRWLETNRKHTLHGIDGLYFAPGMLLATQNGSSPERVVVFRLNLECTEVVSEQVIERSTATLGDPTHGVIAGGDFFYIANSGWDSLDDNGNLKPGAKMTPARIMRVPLKEL